MGESHKRFLQNMMSNGIISSSQAKALYRHCCEIHGAQYSPERLDEFIGVINSQLQQMFMNIRKGMSEEDGVQYYALVNTAETDITRLSSDYADNELELFKKTMELVIDSENGMASSTDILNSADSLQTKKMKKKEMEHVLNKFVQDKWLTEKQGEYTLSTRCIIEMEPYLRALYTDLIKLCYNCHNILFQNQACENAACGIRLHLPCVARYFNRRKDPRCPSCNQFWPHEIPEIQPETQSQVLSATPAATPSTSNSRRSRKS